MANKLIDNGFIDDACLSEPLPEHWSLLPAPAFSKRRLQWLFSIVLVVCGLLLLQWHCDTGGYVQPPGAGFIYAGAGMAVSAVR